MSQDRLAQKQAVLQRLMLSLVMQVTALQMAQPLLNKGQEEDMHGSMIAMIGLVTGQLGRMDGGLTFSQEIADRWWGMVMENSMEDQMPMGAKKGREGAIGMARQMAQDLLSVLYTPEEAAELLSTEASA